MSKGQTPRTPAHFPRMKHRAAGRTHWIASWGGGYRCSEHGIRWYWGKIDAATLDDIENDIADHEDYHASIGDDGIACGTNGCDCSTGDE